VSEVKRPGVHTRQGKQVLVIPLGANIRQRTLTSLGALQSAPGFLVQENRYREWRVEGFSREAGESYFYGPGEEGVLMEEILTYSPEAALSYIQRLVAALTVLEQQGLAHFELQTDGVVFLRAGGVLFLPPRLMGKIRETRPLAYRRAVYEILNHPDLKKRFPEQHAFSVAVMLYILVCGRLPFKGKSDEDLHSQIRSFRPSPPELVSPGLKAEVSELIMRGLTKDKKASPSLNEYRQSLERWASAGLFADISESEKTLLLRRGAQEEEKHETAFRRRVFWQRYGRRVALIVLAVLIAGGIGASWLKNILAPPATRGFTPVEVVSAFYQGINLLDHSLMSDATADRAGRDMIREVTQVYVVTRVSSAYEGENRFLSADSWDRQGRPPVEPPTMLFGITGLSIVPLEAEPEPVYLVRYEYWRSVVEEAEGAQGAQGAQSAEKMTLGGFRIEERVAVRKKGKDWVIFRIERLTMEAL
jgi:hypothetical protein